MISDKSPVFYVLQSRKFWAAVVGLILMIVAAVVNHQTIDPNTLVNAIMVVVSAYIGAVALEDGMTNRSAGKTTVETPSQNVTVSTSDTTPAPPVIIPPAPVAPVAPPTKPTVGTMGMQ